MPYTGSPTSGKPILIEMHANLVRAPRLELGTNERVPSKALEHAMVRDGLATIRARPSSRAECDGVRWAHPLCCRLS